MIACISACMSLFAVALAAEPGMDYRFRLMAMGVGGVASLFALWFSPPESNREGMIRFAAGCVVAFTCTGSVMHWLALPITPDSVMMVALVWGSIAWSFLGYMVAAGKHGGIFESLARIVQGVAKVTIKPDNSPAVVTQVKTVDEKKGV